LDEIEYFPKERREYFQDLESKGWVEGKTVKIPNSEKLVTIKRHRLPKFTPGEQLKKHVK
jgi:hypothetical protein